MPTSASLGRIAALNYKKQTMGLTPAEEAELLQLQAEALANKRKAAGLG